MTGKAMLSALSVPDALAIADAADATRDDQAAMKEYLDDGRRGGGLRSKSFADLDRQHEAGAFESPERALLVERIAALSGAALVELVALMWVGRGDGDAAAFRRLVAQARFVAADERVHYVAGKGPLGAYLRAGVAKMGTPRGRRSRDAAAG